MSFRKLLRVAVGLAALIPFATCTDFTGPSGRGARVPIVPKFGPAASFARAVYAAAGIEYDRVRILISRANNEVLKDTTVAFSPTSPEISLPLVLTAQPGEEVSATLEYRNADLVLYSGTQTVTTVATGSPAATPTPILIIPVGPGATAETVQISPTSGTFSTTAPVPFTATAFTSTQSPIANAIFGWSVEDVSVATVNAQGVVQPTSKGGVAKVRATTLNGKFAEASITFLTPPASLAVQSGGNQSAMAFDPLSAPVVVKVLDANGLPVPGATVNFAVASGGGSLAVINGVSNASGLVSANWTLGGTVGTQSITATATALPNNPITINATATERPAKTLAFGQQPTKTAMQAAITPAVTVKALDDKGNVVVGYTGAVTIAFDANQTGATLGGTLTVNAVAGVATFANLTVSKSGDGYTLKAGATGLTTIVSSPFTIDQVPAGLSLNAGGSQTKTIGTALEPIVVKVADANGNGVSGVTVTFAVTTGGGSLSATTATTNASGLASVTWTLGSLIGTQSITATSGTLAGSPLTINATATAPAAVALAFVQQPSGATANAAIAPAVTVRAVDADGNTVTGYTGTIALALENANGAILGGTTSVAAVNGVATFSDLAVNLVGSGYKLSATSGTLTAALSSAFIVTAGAPVALRFLVQPSNAIMGVAITPAVQVRVVDAAGNTVDVSTPITLQFTLPIDVALTGNGPVNAVHGIASFPALTASTVMTGQTIKATATGLTDAISNPFTINPLPAVNRTWTGTVSRRWIEPGNWTPTGAPTTQDSVTIGAATNTPVIDTVVTASAILIQAGGALQVNSVDDYVDVNRIYNYGTLQLTSGVVFTYDLISYTPILNYGTVNVDGSIFVGEFRNVGSSSIMRLKGSAGIYSELISLGTITNEGLVEMDDATGEASYLEANDSLVNKSGATINVKAGAGGNRDIFAALRNYGAFNVTAVGLNLGHNATLGSLNAGTMTFTGAQYFDTYAGDSTAVFDNTGNISLGAAEWQFEFARLKARAGSITGTGYFTTYASQLDIDFTKFSGLVLRLDNNTRFTAGSLVVPSGQTVKVGDAEITQPTTVNGTLRVADPLGSMSLLYGGVTVNSGGILEVTNTSQVGANFIAGSTLTVGAGGKVSINGSGANVELDVPASVTNSGTIEMTSTGGAYSAGLYVTGTVTNAVGATITALNGAGGKRYIQNATLDNKGTITINGSTYLELRKGAVTHLNSGTIDIVTTAAGASATAVNLLSLDIENPDGVGSTLSNSGTIKIGSNRTLNIGAFNGVTNSGTISGTGAIDKTSTSTTFSNTGTMAPGAAGTIGTLTFKGNLTMAGTLDIDIQGPSTGSSYDRLTVTGTLTWGGGQMFLRPNGSEGTQQTWTVVTATSHSGSLPTINLSFPPWSGPSVDTGFPTNVIVSNFVIAGPPPN